MATLAQGEAETISSWAKVFRHVKKLMNTYLGMSMEYLRQVADSRSAGFVCMRKQDLHSSRTPLSTLFHAQENFDDGIFSVSFC